MKLKKLWFIITHPGYIASLEHTNQALLTEYGALVKKMDVEEEMWEEKIEELEARIAELEGSE